MFSLLSMEKEATSQGDIVRCQTATKLTVNDVSRQMAQTRHLFARWLRSGR